MATAAQEEVSRTVTLFSGPPPEVPFATRLAPRDDDVRLRDSLSRTLEIDSLLQIFFSQLHIDHAGYEYRNAELGLEYLSGELAGARAEYRLVIAEQELGTLTVCRAMPFAFTELALLEERLCALVYPLRNALLYHSALSSALRDPLTGVDNRAALESRLPREIQLARRHSTPTALLVLDVDRFKHINDSHGHQTGDRVLRKLVAIFQSVLRTTDVICRYGGDEFVVVLNNTDAQGAVQVAERIRERVERARVQAGNVRLVLSTSIGVTELQADDDAHTVFRRADEALLQAKQGGRNKVILV